VSHFPTTGTEDASQRVTYIYDTNSLDTSHTFSNYTSGRLAAVQYGPVNTSTTNPNGTYLPTFAEWYNYQLSGLVATKRLQVLQPNYGITTPQAINFDGAYTYDTGGEGKILSVQYPSTSAGSGSKYTYSFDSMYRPVGMTDQNSNTDVSNVTYNPANQLLSINYFGSSETRTYNSLNQLTAVTGPGISKTYTYTAGANIGKISSQTDALSGETVQYAYDSLNRLTSATTTAGTAWSQTFTYDPFGNLTAKTGTGTAPPSIPVSAQPSAVDLNGNVTGTQGSAYVYDVENRMYEYYSTTGTGVAPAYYAYDTQNRRVWQWNGSTYASPYSTTPNSYTVYFYGVNGKRLAAYTLTAAVVWQGNKVQSLTMNSAVLTQDAYFGGRRLAGLDRVGSATQVGSQNVSFYPYGDDKGTPGANDNWKFGTYLRDSATGLDYAVNRYYSSGSGRFWSVDPSTTPNARTPQAWNRYAYAGDDPINSLDPSGTGYVCTDGGYDSSNGGSSPDCYWQYGASDSSGPSAPDVPGCLAASSFDPSAGLDPACNPPAPIPLTSQPAPMWQIDVGYTPVLGVNGKQYDHLFIWVHIAGVSLSALTSANSEVYDGGPTGNCKPACGNLTAWDSVTGHYDELGNSNMVDFFSANLGGFGPWALAQDFASLSASLSTSNGHYAYNPILGPNSNSLAYTLLNYLRLSLPIQPYSVLGTSAGTLNFNGVTQVFTGWGQYLQTTL
jgi:RHS repeat-associated protein